MKKFSNKLIIFGRIIIFIAPFLPDWFYRLIYADELLYDYRYANMRALEMMPSVKPMVILLFIFLEDGGIIFTKREEK